MFIAKSKIKKKFQNNKEAARKDLNVDHFSINRVSVKNNTYNVFQVYFLYYKYFFYINLILCVFLLYIRPIEDFGGGGKNIFSILNRYMGLLIKIKLILMIKYGSNKKKKKKKKLS